MMTPVQVCAHRPVQASAGAVLAEHLRLKRQEGGTRLPSIHRDLRARRGRGRGDVDQAATVAIDAERVGIPQQSNHAIRLPLGQRLLRGRERCKPEGVRGSAGLAQREAPRLVRQRQHKQRREGRAWQRVREDRAEPECWCGAGDRRDGVGERRRSLAGAEKDLVLERARRGAQRGVRRISRVP